MVFILVLIINTEVAKTTTNFLALKGLGNYLYNYFFYHSFNK